MEGGAQVVKAPARGRAVGRPGFLGRHRHHLETLCGGQSAAADPGVAHLASHGGRLVASAGANGLLYGDSTATQWPPGDWTDGPAQQPGGSPDSARPRLVASNGLGGATPNGTVLHQLRSLGEPEERALSRSL